MYIPVRLLDLIRVQNFYYLMVAWEKILFIGADMSSSVHIDSKRKDILSLGEGPTERLNNTTLTAETLYSINFSRSNRKFCLSLYYICPLCLGKISRYSSDNNIKKTGFKWCVYYFFVDYRAFDTSNIIDFHKDLMKSHGIK